jgi:hypothetical protein
MSGRKVVLGQSKKPQAVAPQEDAPREDVSSKSNTVEMLANFLMNQEMERKQKEEMETKQKEETERTQREQDEMMQEYERIKIKRKSDIQIACGIFIGFFVIVSIIFIVWACVVSGKTSKTCKPLSIIPNGVRIIENTKYNTAKCNTNGREFNLYKIESFASGNRTMYTFGDRTGAVSLRNGVIYGGYFDCNSGSKSICRTYLFMESAIPGYDSTVPIRNYSPYTCMSINNTPLNVNALHAYAEKQGKKARSEIVHNYKTGWITV